MNKQNPKELLNEVTCKVLEKTAFMFPEPADLKDGIDFKNFDFALAKLNFKGDNVGNVMLIAPTEFCIELSANMLGEDIEPDDPKEKYLDALKEALNIIAGQLMTDLYGEQAIYDLTAPDVEELSKEEFFELINGSDYSMAVSDEYPIITIIEFQKDLDEHKSVSS